jgi:hypothetical protein
MPRRGQSKRFSAGLECLPGGAGRLATGFAAPSFPGFGEAFHGLTDFFRQRPPRYLDAWVARVQKSTRSIKPGLRRDCCSAVESWLVQEACAMR